MNTPPSGGPAPPVDPGHPEDTGPPVLVVDDYEGARELMAIALRRAGVPAITAASVQDALVITETRPLAAIVSDLRMPGMSGIDLVRSLRARPGSSLIPVILVTGSGDAHSVIEGLEAGANDFLSKPVRLDELVARVRSLIRSTSAWETMLQQELGVRSAVVAALGEIEFSDDLDESAERVVRAIAERSDVAFVSVVRITPDGRMSQLATFNRADGVRRGGVEFGASLAGHLLLRAKAGPWVEDLTELAFIDRSPALQAAGLDVLASAAIMFEGSLVALLSIGSSASDAGAATYRRARILSATIDYAVVLEGIADRLAARFAPVQATRQRLQRVLDEREFHIVLQPIVDLESSAVIGHEALTRFSDGIPPDVRFAEATEVSMGTAFELATMAAAIELSAGIPGRSMLTINVSPETIVTATDAVRDLVRRADRDVVLEITEHAPIADYAVLNAALDGMGPHVTLAVDDAGAGFASLRHILELRPRFAKLDISLVRGVDGDPMRQALAAGLNYYGLRTGCQLIAEGIETQAEADTLLELGIEFGQGNLFGRPEPLP